MPTKSAPKKKTFKKPSPVKRNSTKKKTVTRKAPLREDTPSVTETVTPQEVLEERVSSDESTPQVQATGEVLSSEPTEKSVPSESIKPFVQESVEPNTPEPELKVESTTMAPVENSTPPVKEKKFSFLKVIIVLVVIALLASLPAYYFYNQYQKTYTQYQAAVKNNPMTAKEEISDVIEKVGKLMELPKGDTVTVATIKDIKLVGNSTFFKNAENGDKVLVFKEANKAILYRPSTNKIIEVGQVSSVSGVPSPSVSPVKSLVVIYNGTTINGLAGTVEKDLMSKDANVSVLSKVTAKQSSYKDTLVIDLSGSHQTQAASIAGQLKGRVGVLPSGEVKPTSGDILIIVGSSYLNK